MAENSFSYWTIAGIDNDMDYHFSTGIENRWIEASLKAHGEKEAMIMGHFFLALPFFSYGIYTPRGLLRDASSRTIPGRTVMEETCGWSKVSEGVSWSKDDVLLYLPQNPVGISWRRRGEHHRLAHWGELELLPWMDLAWCLQGGYLPHNFDEKSWYGDPTGSPSGHYLHTALQNTIYIKELIWQNTLLHSAGESSPPGFSIRERVLLELQWASFFYQFDFSSRDFTTVNGESITNRWRHTLEVEFFLRNFHSFKGEIQIYPYITNEVFLDEIYKLPWGIQWSCNTYRFTLKNSLYWQMLYETEWTMEKWQWESTFSIHWIFMGLSFDHKTEYMTGEWLPFNDSVDIWWSPIKFLRINGSLNYNLQIKNKKWEHCFTPALDIKLQIKDFELLLKGEMPPMKSGNETSFEMKEWTLSLNIKFRIDK